jgi:outer membrane lipoprotein-sorting protein
MKRLFILILLGLFPLGAIAQTQEQTLAQAIANAKNPQAKGLAIAKMAEYRDTGWQDNEAKLTMILRNRQGKKSNRRMRSKYMEVAGDGDKSMSIFKTPRDIKGTAMLTWSHALKPDHQWLYLPALKRVKRISSKNKSGPFMGSEFAYEDLSSQEIAKYSYKYLRDENYNGINCFVVERYPAYKHSGYTRQVAWIDKQHFNAQQTVFYDRKNALLKTLTFKDYRQYLGKYWRANEMFMQNHQTGKNTTLKFKEFKFRQGLKDSDFNKSALKRAR